MRSLKAVLVVWLACSLVSGIAWAQGSFYLRDGDRVVFYGDSITEQRLYTTFAETYVVTRFPRLDVSFVHSGVGGDRVTGGWAGPIDQRLTRDVFACKPTVMTIMLGMNDGSYRAFDDKIFQTYATGYQHILDSIKDALPGIRLTLIQPSPYDDVTRPAGFEGGYNAVLVRYGEFVKELAQKQDCQAADLNTSVVAVLERAKATDAETAKRIIADRVHPGPGGHLLMAEALLKIDGQEVGTFSRQQLEEGLNLAQWPTPMVQQAQAVHNLTLKHNNIHATCWRELKVALAGQTLPHLAQAVEALNDLEADLVAQQRETAQPKARRYELLPQ